MDFVERGWAWQGKDYQRDGFGPPPPAGPIRLPTREDIHHHLHKSLNLMNFQSELEFAMKVKFSMIFLKILTLEP